MLTIEDLAWTILGGALLVGLAFIGAVFFSGCSLFGALPTGPAETTPAATQGLTAPHVVCRCSSTVSGLAWCVEYEGGGVAAAAVATCLPTPSASPP